MLAIVASPHSSAHEPASDRPSWNDDLPQMPDFRPCWFRARQARILNILVITSHHFVRSVGVGRTPFDRLAIALTREPSLVAAAAHEIALRARWVYAPFLVFFLELPSAIPAGLPRTKPPSGV
jgi:hypothetical protein